MATSSSPPSPLYDHDPRDAMFAAQPYYLPDAYAAPDARAASSSYFYAAADGPSANPLHHGTHDASAARLAQNQTCASHQYYGGASPGALPYAAEYLSHHEWLPPKHAPAEGTHAYAAVAPLPPFYDSGEVSPASDDSGAAFYDSPRSSDDARLVDDRAGPDAHPHAHALATYPLYDAASFPSPSLITAERFSYPAGERELAPQAAPAYYDEPAAPVFQPAPQHLGGAHLAFAGDFVGAPEDGDALRAHHAQEYLERPPSGDHHPSPARYGGALGEPARGARASAAAMGQQRSRSPMAHLPYVEDAFRDAAAERYSYFPPAAAGAGAYAYGEPACPQPQYHGAGYPAPIAIPAPRSPPLVEDTPKKPLTLACFFCRKRKIACGSPPPGRKDRTCNQCARRNLRCEYPVNSRRGTRQRDAEPALYPGSAGYARVSS